MVRMVKYNKVPQSEAPAQQPATNDKSTDKRENKWRKAKEAIKQFFLGDNINSSAHLTEMYRAGYGGVAVCGLGGAYC